MQVDAFNYSLPPDRIAARPAVPRDTARLLIVAKRLVDCCVGRLPELLAPGDILVCNDTKVIPARLFGQRGAVAIEAVLLRRLVSGNWRALVRPARRLKPGQIIAWSLAGAWSPAGAPEFSAEVIAKDDGGEVEIRFDRDGAALDDALARCGTMPVPPYIVRDGGRGGVADSRDRDDYQTIFACRPGAVAAPTAGLHFTPRLLDALQQRGIGRATVTLHVGAGTFLPVRAAEAEDHPIHAEWGEITPEAASAINAARASGGRIVAVGTTALRLLETASAEDGWISPFAGETRLFILPGYCFRAVDVLLTNFHLPRSTLLMLVSAFAGLARIRQAYAHALEKGYRFYSYGDACLLFPERAR